MFINKIIQDDLHGIEMIWHAKNCIIWAVKFQVLGKNMIKNTILRYLHFSDLKSCQMKSFQVMIT